jgi:hypothetical protein
MANNRWEPKAGAVANAWTLDIDTGGAGSVTLTINGKSLAVTAGSLTTDAQIAKTVKQAWENETFTDTTATKTPADGGQDVTLTEFKEITATVSGTIVTLTHDTPGRPVTITRVDGGSVASTLTDATSATGPNDVNNTANWSAGSLPAAAEDIFIDNSAVSLLYNLDQLGDTMTSLNIGANFTGEIGLPKNNAAGYLEYLPDYLQLAATTVNIGRGDGSGSGRMKLDLGAVASTINVEDTGASPEFGLGALIIKGTHADNILSTHGGSVSVAPFGGESATIKTSNLAGGTVDFGAGTTLQTVGDTHAMTIGPGATVTVRSDLDAVTNNGGTLIVQEAAAVTLSLTLNGGTTLYNSSGTITLLTIGGVLNPVLDFTGAANAPIVTASTHNAGHTIIDPTGTVTWSSVTIGGDVNQMAFS